MNKRKPKVCALKDDQIAELGEILKHKFMTCGEIISYVEEHFNYKTNLTLILSNLAARGFNCAEEERRTAHGKKRYYRIFTKEDYEKIEEEHRENATRRILAAVSY